MVGVRFTQIAEQKSAEMAESLIGKLLESPQTAALRLLDIAILREEFGSFFANLRKWLLVRTKAEIELKFSALGRMCAGYAVPLDHCVNAMLACRDHLVEYLRQHNEQSSSEELFRELEFEMELSGFFDDAIFFLMRGYRCFQLADIEVA